MHLLRTIYYSIFNFHLIYAYEIWGQNQNNLWFTKLTKLQNKALKVINFQSSDSPTGPLYQENKVLKIAKYSASENCSLWTIFCKVSSIRDMEQASKNPES